MSLFYICDRQGCESRSPWHDVSAYQQIIGDWFLVAKGYGEARRYCSATCVSIAVLQEGEQE